jgi:YggT family protein
MIEALLWLFNTLVFLYIAALVAVVLMSWLTAFHVVDPQNAIVDQVDRGLYGVTNPLLNPVRRLVPAVGGLDLSPIIMILLLGFLKILVDDLIPADAISSGASAHP